MPLMPAPPAPNLPFVPLPPPPTHISAAYTYTAPSPSSLEAWQNKPKRVEQWSRTVSPRPVQNGHGTGGSGSWGKGVGVGSAEWSGTTAPPETDGGTEPTTFRYGKDMRVRKEDRAGEVVREQRKMGSQASAGSGIASKAIHGAKTQADRGKGRKVGMDLAVPTRDQNRPPPTPYLALPNSGAPASHSPPPPTVLRTGTQDVHSDPYIPAQPARPPLRPLGSDASGASARSQRDAFIASALASPLDMLGAVQRDQPNLIHKKGRVSGEDGPVRKSKSNNSATRRASETVQTKAAEVRKAVSGTSAEARGRKASENVRLDRSKTLPVPGLPDRLAPRTFRLDANPPSSSIVTAPSLPPLPSSIPPHRRPTPMLRPALSRSGSSINIVAGGGALGLHPSTGKQHVQTRFEPEMYPLPPSGTTTNVELSPVRQVPEHASRPVNSLGSGASRKAKMPIVVDVDPSLTESSTGQHHHATPLNHPSRPVRQAYLGRTDHAAQPPIILHHPPDRAHRDRSPAHNEATASPGLSPTAAELPSPDGDRISFEIPSGTRGRLRVSLAWFRDVGSSRRWKERFSPGRESPDGPPPLPSKDDRWEGGTHHHGPGRLHHPPPSLHQPGSRQPSLRPPVSPSYPRRPNDRDFLAVPPQNREREGVRFSPQPIDIPAPVTAWTPRSAPPHMPNPYFASPQYPPYAPRPAYAPAAYPPPSLNPWAAISLPNLYPPTAVPPNTQPPPSLNAPSIDPPSDGSPPAINRLLPAFQQMPPGAYPQPAMRLREAYNASSAIPLGYADRQGTRLWYERPSVWQKLFGQNRQRENGQPIRGEFDPKDGLINRWRRNVGNGEAPPATAYVGARSYVDVPAQQRSRIWRFGSRGAYGRPNQRQDGHPIQGESSPKDGWVKKWRRNVGNGQAPPATAYAGARSYVDIPAEQKTRIWRFGTRGGPGRPNQRQDSAPKPASPYPPPPQDRAFLQRRPAPTVLPVKQFSTAKERLKAERRTQRKERRDRRYYDSQQPQRPPPPRGGARTELHPDDSITRAGAPVLPILPIATAPDTRHRRGRPGWMVRDWVRSVGARRNGGDTKAKEGDDQARRRGVPEAVKIVSGAKNGALGKTHVSRI